VHGDWLGMAEVYRWNNPHRDRRQAAEFAPQIIKRFLAEHGLAVSA